MEVLAGACPTSVAATVHSSNKRRNVLVKVKSSGENNPSFEAAIHRASLRFQETHRPDPLFIDPYAGCLVSPNIRMEMKQQIPRYCIATRFIDDKMLSTLQTVDDFRQVVLLTDGMDTRPYRLNWPRSTMIFDISPQKVFEITTQKLEGVGAKISRSCFFAHVPLESSNIEEILRNKAFKGTRPSIWAFQGLPLVNLEKLKEILCIVSNLATNRSLLLGELPTWFADAEVGTKATKRRWMEKLFMSNGFRVEMIGYDEVAKKLGKIAAEEGEENLLFTAHQLRFSDDQMEIWRKELQRVEEEADEEGFEEL